MSATVFEAKLIEWLENPEQLRDEGCDPPTREALESALRWLRALANQEIDAKVWLVPTGDGGVTFSGTPIKPLSWSLEFDEMGKGEYVVFLRGKIIGRSFL